MKSSTLATWVIFLPLLFAAVSCSDSTGDGSGADGAAPPRGDGGGAHDASAPADAGTPGDTGGARDASGGDTEADAGSSDAADAGGATDADAADDVLDAGAPDDAGVTADASIVDAAGADAGVADTGVTDAGAADGGADASQVVEHPPDAWGKYEVGVYNSNLIYDTARKKTVPMYFWYPASAAGTKQALYMGLMKGKAWQDGTPAKADGPFPLILFSHGFKGIAFQSYSLTEYLTSHGFVVAAPNHQGNTLFDFNSTDQDVAKVTMERPGDIGFTYTKAVEYGKTAGHVLEGLVREDLTAITGHSFGAFTAIIVAGAEADMDRAKAACAAGVQADIFCPYVQYYAPGTILKMDPQIPGLKVMVDLTPGGYNAMFDDGLAKVYVPSLTMGGTEDTTCPVDIETRPIYNGLPKPKAFAILTGASHMSFTNVCSVPMAKQIIGDMCNMSIVEDRAFEIINTLSTAFIRRHLLGETAMDQFLSKPYISATFTEVDWTEDR